MRLTSSRSTILLAALPAFCFFLACSCARLDFGLPGLFAFIITLLKLAFQIITLTQPLTLSHLWGILLLVKCQHQLIVMITKNQHQCPKCKQEYSLDNPPKLLINCAHSLCLACLQEEIICPLDKLRIERRKYKLESFSTNHALLNQMFQAKQQTQLHAHSTIASRRPSSDHPYPTPSTYKSPKTVIQDQPSIVIDNNLPTSTPRDSSFQSPVTNKHLPSAPINPQAKFETCLLHSKKANLICIQDKKLICADCGLFGEHKPHELITYEKFVEQYSAMTEECFQTYKQLQQRESALDLAGFEQELNDLLAKKREKELAKIKKHVRLCSDLLKAVEKQLINHLDVAIGVKRQKLLKSISFADLVLRKEDYLGCVQKMSEGLTHLFSPHHLEQYITFLDSDNPNSLIHKSGLYLLLEIDNYTRMATEKMSFQAQQFQFLFTPPSFELFQSTFSFTSYDKIQVQAALENAKQLKQPINPKINTPCKNAKTMNLSQNIKRDSPIQTEDQTLLLENNGNSPPKSNINQASLIENPSFNLQLISLSGFDSRLNNSTLKPDKSSKQKINSSRLLKIPKSGNKSLKYGSSQRVKTGLTCENQAHDHDTSRKSNTKNIHSGSAERELKNVLGDKNTDLKKKRRLQLPERQAKVYQELLKDKLQVLDLGKGFLGNANVLAISELFPSRSRLKVVKLMDNRITDQIFGHLVSRCKNVQSLNLGGNLLSEKSLEWLEKEAGNLGELRNITLSLNKIVLRNVKQRLQELKERGLTVSL